MINPEVIAEQIRRLCAIFETTFPSDQIAQRELFRAFETACENDQQVREVGDYLARTCRFSPVPADVHRAREALAESKVYNREAPSYRYAPGSSDGNLVDGMTVAEYQGWSHMAQNGTRDQRLIAQAVVEQYEKTHANTGSSSRTGAGST